MMDDLSTNAFADDELDKDASDDVIEGLDVLSENDDVAAGDSFNDLEMDGDSMNDV